jgi:hypothetical protein
MARVQQTDEFHVSYQNSLRSIGAYIDGEARSNVRVLELLDGFLVISQGTGDGTGAGAKVFTHRELQTAGVGPGARKGRLFKKGDSSRSPYQNLFRALGYLLETERAFLIVVDESADGLLVTYQHHDPLAGFMLHKRHLVFDTAGRAKLVDEATQRRRKK